MTILSIQIFTSENDTKVSNNIFTTPLRMKVRNITRKVFIVASPQQHLGSSFYNRSLAMAKSITEKNPHIDTTDIYAGNLTNSLVSKDSDKQEFYLYGKKISEIIYVIISQQPISKSALTRVFNRLNYSYQTNKMTIDLQTILNNPFDRNSQLTTAKEESIQLQKITKENFDKITANVEDLSGSLLDQIKHLSHNSQTFKKAPTSSPFKLFCTFFKTLGQVPRQEFDPLLPRRTLMTH